MSSQTPSKPSISYKDAGVDIAAGNALVDRIKHVAKRTACPRDHFEQEIHLQTTF